MASWNKRDITNEHLLPYVDSNDASPEVASALNTLPFQRNIFKLLANAPNQMPIFMKLLSSCWSADNSLRATDWQLVVLRTAATLNAPYEWDVNAPVAEVLGFTEAQFSALKDATRPLPEELFTPRKRLLAKLVDEVNANNIVSVESMKEAQGVFGDRGVAEFFFLNGVYGFLARFMNSARIDFDPPIPGLEDMLRKYNAAAIEKEKAYTD
ncbi:uncharacterized protein MYCFIDRAFT_46679 [Pseudocercospora fijiensis CIRAD86]|uniref:Carboxymuconolactone decarboxylase-like domain-containing protein n=1 Tax=Pseudocercospora fijiensis (strain CIRAD86) TaxID=383855 RepID=M3A218_PSEFD|nr:uncharacterized protein MYCFIDRAFT_46679 [Pseudocercospora fijiensis CIRAD86]EME85209.1 hypothetical protein MYCFIDRAFT_46679 [Pseudocercospora fijiensis CIRAD86]